MKKIEKSAADGDIGLIFEELEFVESSLRSSLPLRSHLDNPRVPYAEKVKTFRNIFKDYISPKAYDFIYVLLRSNTMNMLENILRNYKRLTVTTGILEFEVKTSIPLTPDEKNNLAHRFSEKIGKPVTIRNIVDPTIIGGLIIKAGDMMVDASIDTKLKRLINQLRKG